MSLYLDASVLVALFTDDPFTRRADSFLRENASVLMVSDFAAAEFASALGRHVRTKEIKQREARIALATFDAWTEPLSSRSTMP